MPRRLRALQCTSTCPSPARDCVPTANSASGGHAGRLRLTCRRLVSLLKVKGPQSRSPACSCRDSFRSTRNGVPTNSRSPCCSRTLTMQTPSWAEYVPPLAPTRSHALPPRQQRQQRQPTDSAVDHRRLPCMARVMAVHPDGPTPPPRRI